MVEYTVVRGRYLDILIDEVNDYLKEGWDLNGGIAGNDGWYCQSLIRKEEETD